MSLKDRIEELEKKVKELEARPPVMIPQPYPVPQLYPVYPYYPQPWYPTPYPWYGSPDWVTCGGAMGGGIYQGSITGGCSMDASNVMAITYCAQ